MLTQPPSASWNHSKPKVVNSSSQVKGDTPTTLSSPAARAKRCDWARSKASKIRPPSKCRVTIKGNSFMVTVKAPKAPCKQTHSKVKLAHQGFNAAAMGLAGVP